MSKVIVAGSIITDMSVSVEEHPKVGETVIGDNLTYSPGGKGANQAVSAARLGAKTVMIGKVGFDDFGKMCNTFIHDQGIYLSVNYSQMATGIAMIMVNTSGDNSIVVNIGANADLKIEDLEDKDVTYEKGDVLVSQFEIPLETVEAFFKKGKEAECINVLNPAPAIDIPKSIMDLVDVLIVNETELESISKYSINKNALVDNTITAMNRISNIMRKNSIIITTLGDKGLIAMRNRYVIPVMPIKVNAIDTTGAGDCFVGAFSSFISSNDISSDKDLKEALKFANKAASLSVQKKGSGISMPYLKDI